jgi:WD40 repeat protein
LNYNIKVLFGHTNKVHHVDFNGKCTLLVSGSEDWNIKIWEIKGYSCVRTLFGHKDGICKVHFSANG